MHFCGFLLAFAAVPIWSKALNDIDACTNRKIYVLDLAVYAAENHHPTCDVMKVRNTALKKSSDHAGNGCSSSSSVCRCHRTSRLTLAMAFPIYQTMWALQQQKVCLIRWLSIRAPGTSCRPSITADMSPRTSRPQMLSTCMTTATTCYGWPRCAYEANHFSPAFLRLAGRAHEPIRCI